MPKAAYSSGKLKDASSSPGAMPEYATGIRAYIPANAPLKREGRNLLPGHDVDDAAATEVPMPERPEARPMQTFDPTLPVVVHEASNDVEVEWVPVTAEEWAAEAEWTDDSQTVVRWRETLLDRWWLARDEEVHPDQPIAAGQIIPGLQR
jgi:hypothetical protein